MASKKWVKHPEKNSKIEERREQRKAMYMQAHVDVVNLLITYRTGRTVQSVISSSQTGSIHANCKNAGNTVFSCFCYLYTFMKTS